eukprot:123022_1
MDDPLSAATTPKTALKMDPQRRPSPSKKPKPDILRELLVHDRTERVRHQSVPKKSISAHGSPDITRSPDGHQRAASVGARSRTLSRPRRSDPVRKPTGSSPPKPRKSQPTRPSFAIDSCQIVRVGRTDLPDRLRFKSESTSSGHWWQHLVAGEDPIVKDIPVRILNPATGKLVKGLFYVTNYRIFVRVPNKVLANESFNFDTISCPLSCIDRLEKVGPERNLSSFLQKEVHDGPRSQSHDILDIYTRQMRTFRLAFPSSNPTITGSTGGSREPRRTPGPVMTSKRQQVYELLLQFAFPSKLDYLFAFSHNLKYPVEVDGWKLYDPIIEFVRMGVPSDNYRMSLTNTEYELCDTYPRILVVPAAFPDNDISAVAEFRARQRIPVLCWKRRHTDVAIFRCSQPRVGVRLARCEADENLLKAINAANSANDSLLILDARPKVNAQANRLTRGAGYEQVEHYGNCSLKFLNIENIHTMRDALQKLGRVFMKNPEREFWSEIESTNYVMHLRQILKATLSVVFSVDIHNKSVVIHCSDGWDRTTQLCALAELCLDPYYRTFDGFMVLIEKEWLSYGHAFNRRTGHRDKNYTDDQRSPIFQQFIEVVWNLTEQFPTAFEFSSSFLATIMDHLFSCRFGTFLVDTEREKRELGLEQKTISLWTYMKGCDQADTFFNPIYDPTIAGPVLYPTHSSKKVRLWADYWLRWFDFESLHGRVCRRDDPDRMSSGSLMSQEGVMREFMRKQTDRLNRKDATIAELRATVESLNLKLNHQSSPAPAPLLGVPNIPIEMSDQPSHSPVSSQSGADSDSHIQVANDSDSHIQVTNDSGSHIQVTNDSDSQSTPATNGHLDSLPSQSPSPEPDLSDNMT